MASKKVNRNNAAAQLDAPRIRLCDYRSIKLSDLDIARAKATARESREISPEEETFVYLLTTSYVDMIVEGSEVYVPQAIVRERAIDMAMALEKNLERAGKSLKDYYEGTNSDEETLIKGFEVDALRQLEGRYALLAIARTQGLTCTKREYTDELKRLSEMYLTPDLDKLAEYLKQAGEDKKIKDDISINKASKYVEKLVRKQLEERGEL